MSITSKKADITHELGISTRGGRSAVGHHSSDHWTMANTEQNRRRVGIALCVASAMLTVVSAMLVAVRL
ncbi:MAG: hypothetical protein IPK66_01750 [Rhodospirillales bacterium]|nr:hypothetical protein [Rhodospirillales bacterium]